MYRGFYIVCVSVGGGNRLRWGWWVGAGGKASVAPRAGGSNVLISDGLSYAHTDGGWGLDCDSSIVQCVGCVGG